MPSCVSEPGNRKMYESVGNEESIPGCLVSALRIAGLGTNDDVAHVGTSTQGFKTAIYFPL